MMCKRIILSFEGLSGAGKTSTISELLKFSDIKAYNPIVFNRNYKKEMDILYNDFDRVKLPDSDKFQTLLKLNRYGIFLNYAIQNPTNKLIIFDRGLLNIFIALKSNSDNINFVTPYLDYFNEIQKDFIVVTAILRRGIIRCNKRIIEKLELSLNNDSKKDVNRDFEFLKAENKQIRNSKQEKFFTDFEYLNDLNFIGEKIFLDGDEEPIARANQVLAWLHML